MSAESVLVDFNGLLQIQFLVPLLNYNKFRLMYTVASALSLVLMLLDWYRTHLNLVLALTLMLNGAIETN